MASSRFGSKQNELVFAPSMEHTAMSSEWGKEISGYTSLGLLPQLAETRITFWSKMRA